MSARQHKLTPKQEAFVSAYLKTGNATKAYKKSYRTANMTGPSINREAIAVLNNPKIASRVEAYRAKMQQNTEISVERLTNMTLAAYDLAMEPENSQTSAAVKATEFIAKLHGMIIEKSERLNVNADLTDILRDRLKAAKTIDHEISA